MKRDLIVTAILTAVVTGFLLLPLMTPNRESSLQKFIDDTHCPGFVSYVGTARGETWNAFGLSDAEHAVKMSPDTVFQIASMSKSFCGVLAAQMISEGRIALETPVESVFPEFSDLRVQSDGCLRKPRTPLTFQHCLSMTGGLAVHSPHKTRYGFASLSLRDEARQMADQPLLTDPGTHFAYCNAGIDIAAAMLETVSGRTYEQLLDDRILRPLEMFETTFSPSDEQLRRLAVIYEMPANEPSILNSSRYGSMEMQPYASAAAGLYSTARDLVKFYQMLAHRGVGGSGARILSESGFNLLTTRLTSQTDPGYSLGFSLEGDWLNHCGAFCTYGAANVKNGDVRIFLSQLVGRGAEDILRRWQGMNDAFQTVGLKYKLL